MKTQVSKLEAKLTATEEAKQAKQVRPCPALPCPALPCRAAYSVVQSMASGADMLMCASGSSVAALRMTAGGARQGAA
jgi:hypothetical protein